MHEIRKYRFEKKALSMVKEYRYGHNWPVVYVLEDGKEAYIGETVNVSNRAFQHYEKPEKAKLNNLYIIADDEYNRSATQDIEAGLIKYFSGDGKYFLQNANYGLHESEYYDRERYQAKFQIIWKNLLALDLARKDLAQIENDDLFKYSPYKSLSDDQRRVVEQITDDIKKESSHPHLVSGEPGTGKTIVATYLVKYFQEKEWSKNYKVGLVIPMTSLRTTLKRVFNSVRGLSADMVIGPNDVVKEFYDILIVDEAHRLQRRVNITNFKAFDNINKALGLNKYKGTQLDWIMKSSRHQILFYDENQTIKPADLRRNIFSKYNFCTHRLISQMRVLGGIDYIEYIRSILSQNQTRQMRFSNYEFFLFENIEKMIDKIREKEKRHGLSRLLAGYAWEWKTRRGSAIDYDIEFEGVKLKWNSVTKDWVNSKNAINEVGCIHTIQGYDLNYAGVIVGPEISYDSKNNKISVDKSKYLDFNGKRAITDPQELEIYVKNIYKTLLTRGIRGTYIYVVDKALQEYLKKFVPVI